MKKAVFVAVDLGNNADFSFYLDETMELLHTAGYEVCATIVQKSRSLDPSTAVRSGKLEEILLAIQQYDAEALVFYNSLSFAMISKLEEVCGISIIDRSHLILDIFALHAHSKEAQLQIELARLKYALPKRIKEQGSEDQSGGSLHNKGSGESRSALQARANKRRIAALEKELEVLKKHRDEQSRHRNKSRLKKVALVGYTNVGKSSLMNALLNDPDKGALALDRLFATLDVTTRKVKACGREFLLYDTVGFVSDLPHELIETFRSTLAAACDADLLLKVTDASSSHTPMQKEVTNETLKRIHADEIPGLEVSNKIDLLPLRHPDVLEVSATTGEGLNRLREEIVSILYPCEKTEERTVPYFALSLLDEYGSIAKIERLQEKEEGVLCRISAENDTVEQFVKALKEMEKQYA